MHDEQQRAHIRRTILDRFQQGEDRRQEALQEFLALTMPSASSEHCAKLATLIPAVTPELYDKWISLFLDRLQETVAPEQVQDMCDGTESSNAVIMLVFLMFMESERMEKQIAEDLAVYGRQHSGDPDLGLTVAEYLRAKTASLGQQLKKTHIQ